MKQDRGKENRATAATPEYDLVPRLPASHSSNDYSHPLPLLPHIATVTDTSDCEQWQPRLTVPLCTEHASDPHTWALSAPEVRCAEGVLTVSYLEVLVGTVVITDQS
jgi:hypothetical protein